MKTVLVLNEMPKCCDDCPCMYDTIYCQAIGKSLSDIDEWHERLDSCPLKELPERRKTKDYEWTYALNAIFSDGINQGWNDCLDTIEGTEDE